MAVLVVDSGLSLTKVAVGSGDDDKPQVYSFESGARRVSVIENFSYTGDVINVAGQRWETCIPNNTSTNERFLNRFYYTSETYAASVFSAIQKAECRIIDLCVLTLPPFHENIKTVIRYLKKKFEGLHNLGTKPIYIRKVMVVPSIVGVFEKFKVDMANDLEIKNINFHDVLAIDAGYFSVDFGVFDHGVLDKVLSGSSSYALSKVFEDAAGLASARFGVRVHADLFENAMINKQEILQIEDRYHHAPVSIDSGAEHICPHAMKEIQSIIRGSAPTMLLLAGGGSAIYRNYAGQYLKHVSEKVIDIEGIAEGLWYWGRREMSKF